MRPLNDFLKTNSQKVFYIVTNGRCYTSGPNCRRFVFRRDPVLTVPEDGLRLHCMPELSALRLPQIN